jgi:hypothetical protein
LASTENGRHRTTDLVFADGDRDDAFNPVRVSLGVTTDTRVHAVGGKVAGIGYSHSSLVVARSGVRR